MCKSQTARKNYLFAALSLLLITLILPADNTSAGNAQSRIVNGKIVPAGKYPWMVALLYRFGGSGQEDFICGGSLIDRQWVLTAAHCVSRSSPEYISVSVNSVDLRKEEDIDRIPVTDILIHSSFTNLGYRDIALLRLERKVAANIPTLNLIESGTELDAGTTVTTMGWGKTQSYTFGREVSRRLQETDLEVGFRQICDNYSTPFLPDHEICLASPTRDSIECSGDSGGPSVIKDETTGEYSQVGIVSWGSGGCDTHYGTAHTRIAGLTKWIARQIAGRPADYETVTSERPSDHEVRMVTRTRFIGRVVETLKVKVKRGRGDTDKMRIRLGNGRFISSDSNSFTKFLYDAGQGTWLYGGPATFTRNRKSGNYSPSPRILVTNRSELRAT